MQQVAEIQLFEIKSNITFGDVLGFLKFRRYRLNKLSF